MKEIVIISGKGGTGKTSVTAALSFIVGDKAVITDCDVDAADMHLILEPEIYRKEQFYSGYKAVIDNNLCINCGECARICRFDAIIAEEDNYQVDLLNCEGCSYCYHVCPAKAIEMQEQLVGECYLSHTRAGSIMSHSKLGIGADNSGKLVAKVKNDAKEIAKTQKLQYVLVDGSPGIGCPVISSLSGADCAVIVTEPTVSGISDMKRVCELAKKFMIPLGCIINKADLNPALAEEIKDYLKIEKIELLAILNYDNDFHEAITKGLSLVEYNEEKWRHSLENIWNMIINLNNKGSNE